MSTHNASHVMLKVEGDSKSIIVPLNGLEIHVKDFAHLNLPVTPVKEYEIFVYGQARGLISEERFENLNNLMYGKILLI